MESDYIICSALGTISSKINVIKQKNNLQMISFSLNIATHKERVQVKLFDTAEETVEKFVDSFSFGDRVKILGEIKSDSFLNKDRLIKGICIIPTEITLIEKTNISSNKTIIINK